MDKTTPKPSSAPSYLDAAHGWRSWLLTRDHKRIAMLYLTAISVFFVAGVTIGVAMRLELMAPGRTIMGPQTYNALFTLHGVIMIFLFIIPGIPAVFGNFVLPLQIGAEDVFFPRLNLFSWYLYMFGAVFALSTLFIGGCPTRAGPSMCRSAPPRRPTSRWPRWRSSFSVSRPSSPG